MKKSIMYLFARTPVHVGAGNSVGAVDSPVMRERHTRIPIIPGSSLKGVLSDLWFNDDNMKKICRGDKEVWVRKEGSAAAILFGQEDYKEQEETKVKSSAGSLMIGEARVLAFPVRSARGMFAWITCPLVLNRFKRDSNADFLVPELKGETALAFGPMKLKNNIILEEYKFSVVGEPSSDLIEEFKPLVANDDVWAGIAEQLVVVSDEIFKHFCEHACEIVTRIKVDDGTGTVASGALFNQEQVPSETLFYASVMSKESEIVEAFETKLKDEQWLQIGGDATIGLGLCSVNLMEVK